MRLRIIATVVVAAGLTLGAALPAAASPIGHKPKPKPAAQITGSKLNRGLLPGDAFGVVRDIGGANTGSKLWPSRAWRSVSGTDCATFQDYAYLPGFGETAAASHSYYDPNIADNLFFANETVQQFASSQAASSYFNQTFAKYKSCSFYTENLPDSVGGGQLELTLEGSASTSVGHYQAFTIVQAADGSTSGSEDFQDTMFVVAGTDVIAIQDVDIVSQTIDSSLMSQFIGRVLAQYKH